MSEWRQKGFVLDSDEEEDELKIESQNSKQDGLFDRRVDRVLEPPGAQNTHETVESEVQQGSGKLDIALNGLSRALDRKAANRTPQRPSLPRPPSLSPFTPPTRSNTRRECFESPELLQSSPSAKVRSQQQSSQEELQLRAYALSSQILGEITQTILEPRKDSTTQDANVSAILSEFGVAGLSDNSEDELDLRQPSDEESNLSDYPSDLSDTDPQLAIAYATPHRRTAVQVVIPTSTAVQHQLAEEEARRRNLRQRKPIQMHPYMLEGERYRREVQSRGLKPVPRERSPLRRQGQDIAESQEEEFNPFRNDSSSPADHETSVSTPIAQYTGNNAQQSSSIKRPRRSRSQHGSPATQLRVPKAAKRRKLNIPLSQALATPARTSGSSPVPLDVWSIPPNSPPYSSPSTKAQSGRLLSNRKTESLPTPSNSSSFHDEPPPLQNADCDPVPRSARRSERGLRRPIRIILSDNAPSDSDAASSASEQEDGELQKASKRIRGVLPASWLRIDRQAQERRQALARQRARQSANQSLELAGTQRGVALRVIRPSQRPNRPPRINPALEGIVVISDESDQELEPPIYCQSNDVQGPTEDELALATLFDNRYADSNDNLASMERNRLQLSTLGDLSPKRKRQPKIKDALVYTDRTSISTPTGIPKSSRHSRLASGFLKRRKHFGSKSARSPPPALSVMDVELPPDVPQFLKLARRAARRDVNQARQSPNRKQIRLHTAQDTKDANAALQQWQQGLLKPKVERITTQQRSHRPLLADTTENGQHAPRTSNLNKGVDNVAIGLIPIVSTSRSHGRKIVAPALQVLQRSSTSVSKPSRLRKVARFSKGSERVAQPVLAVLRAAQLEGDEKDFGHRHRKIAFQKGLQRVDQQSGNYKVPKQPFLNPQLARFLADDEIMLPPSPTTKGVEKLRYDDSEDVRAVSTKPKRRSRRKPEATRLDVDARKYRQPSEPVFEPISNVASLNPTESATAYQNGDVLLGLGPFGTQYPITFDVLPLKSDTYFRSDTFVGSEDLRRALSIGKPGTRDMDEPAGYCVLPHGLTTIRCGPWSDETYSQITEMLATILPPLDDTYDEALRHTSIIDALTSLSVVLRALAAYISNQLSFSDPIDRGDFTIKMRHLVQTLFDQISMMHTSEREVQTSLECTKIINRVLSYLLVIGTQLHQIASHSVTVELDRARLLDTIRDISQCVVKNITRESSTLYQFHERNKFHKERENGIRGDEILVETVVICMHALELLNAPSLGFWDLVSQELSLPLSLANQTHVFENVWATIFSLLPFTEFDLTGIPDKVRLRTFDKDNWYCLCTLLKRVLGFYAITSRQSGSSINEYIRVNFTRCFVLINEWNWKRPDQILNVIFDFFGKHGLKPLRRETATSSAEFLRDFTAVGSLNLAPDDSAFHIALKCLATGLQGMSNAYPEKKLRSFVFRRIPNHGRTYPKDQPFEEASLAALRNHHDLLSTLYCAVPFTCRPKLERIRDLVSHDTSHREACKVSVRTWANLATFQLSTDEAHAVAKPFALWYKNITHQTLQQYRLAKTEVQDYVKSGILDETTEIVAAMVKQTMERNQEQVIATLRDSIAGMKRAVKRARDQGCLAAFLAESDMINLLELPHLEDRRLFSVIRDTLSVLQQYVSMQRAQVQQQVSQQRSEESQDYGDFPDLEDLDDAEESQPAETVTIPQPSRFDFIQGPLWHLMSNAFGAEHSPDDNLLLDCVDTWVLIAGNQVLDGGKDWSYYIDPFSQVSWQQLRPTEQTRKFGPYFMAALITYNPAAYEEHRQEFLTALLLCLADRESMLRFQHRLLIAILRADGDNPLLTNLPFFRNDESGGWDITADTLRSRRLALISSLLSNMREDVYATAVQEPTQLSLVKTKYAAMLIDFMTRLKSNYQQLQRGAVVAGAYVEFVQKIVQFLKQYTSDICPVPSFFTDSVAFPLPSTDPTYVVGRLCAYAPKAQDPGTAKQLSCFIQHVALQAAADGQQSYLVNQLTAALCTNEAPIADRVALRTILLQGIFPAYIERAFASRVGYLIARPILRCLSTVLDMMVHDLRINQDESLSTTIESIVSIAHSFIRGTEHLKGDILLLQLPSTLSGLVYMFDTVTSISRLLDYIVGRTMRTTRNSPSPLITYLDEFGRYMAHMVEGNTPLLVPSYLGNADAVSFDAKYADILIFCMGDLQSSIDSNWGDDQGSIWFGQGRAKREVVYDIGSLESERAKVLNTLQKFHDTLDELYGNRSMAMDMRDDIIV